MAVERGQSSITARLNLRSREVWHFRKSRVDTHNHGNYDFIETDASGAFSCYSDLAKLPRWRHQPPFEVTDKDLFVINKTFLSLTYGGLA